MTVDQGNPAPITLSANDVGVLDVLTYEFDLGGDCLFETTACQPTLTTVFDRPGTLDISVRVHDDDRGISDPRTVQIPVENVPPVITLSPDQANLTGVEGTPVRFSVAASDAGNDSLTYTFNIGDGSDELVAAVGSAVHAYGDQGTLTATVTVEDAFGSSVSETMSSILATATI